MLIQQTHKVGLDTYVHIYVEVDLSRWLPDKMILKWETYKWAQILDYEYTYFLS